MFTFGLKAPRNGKRAVLDTDDDVNHCRNIMSQPRLLIDSTSTATNTPHCVELVYLSSISKKLFEHADPGFPDNVLEAYVIIGGLTLPVNTPLPRPEFPIGGETF